MVGCADKNALDPLTQLRKCCKINMYNMRIAGANTVLEGEKDTLIRVVEEDREPGQPREFVHRVVLTGQHSYKGVGWVVDGDANKCMSCFKTSFGMFTRKHHCRMCGDIVCSGCSSKRIDLESEYAVGEGGSSRVCNSCFTDHHFKAAKEESCKSRNTPSSKKVPVGKQDIRVNDENAHHNSATSNTMAGSPSVLAIPASELKAPTPNPKSASKSNSNRSNTRSPLGEIKSVKQVQAPKSILKTRKATPAESPADSEDVSPVTNMLNNLNGRWDRSDDGISTPGSITSDISNGGLVTAEGAGKRLTPETSKLMVGSTPNTGASEKYFFTPSSNVGGNVVISTSSSKNNTLRKQQLAAHNARYNTQSSAQRAIIEASATGRWECATDTDSECSNSTLKTVVAGNTAANRNIGTDLSGAYSPLPDTPASSCSNTPAQSPAVMSVLATPAAGARFVPAPSFVIKASVDGYQGGQIFTRTVYINVCKHASVPVPTQGQLRKDKIKASYCIGELAELVGQRGDRGEIEDCLSVDLCYNNQVHVWAYGDENGQNLSVLAAHAIQCVNNAHSISAWISSLPQYTSYVGSIKPMVMALCTLPVPL